MRTTISLNDRNWFVGAVDPQPFPASNDFACVAGWLPAAVPGDVRLDLLRFNKIPDPFLGKNNEASQWVDEYDWWYRREVRLDASENTRSFLVFEGIDYQSAIFWNDAELGRHVGMFSRQTYEIPRASLSAKHHRLGVRVSGGGQLPRVKRTLRERAWAGISNLVLPHAPHSPTFPDRYAALKCHMSYGWDFAPRLLTCGIWDEAWLVQTGAVFLRDVWVQGVPDGRVKVTLDLDAPQSQDLHVQFAVRPKNFDAPVQEFQFSLRLESAAQHAFSFTLREPRAWNPWERGAPQLYVLDTKIFVDGAESDACETTFGLRTIDLAPNPGAPDDSAPWTFVVNGQPQFVRGANWVPADAIPARVTRDDYAALLRLAREANINLLRVWGGGLKEKRAFYELCDELGILVWQEFPLAGAGLDYFPRDRAYLDLLCRESAAIVRALRNHPSVVLWCGGNEFIPRASRHVVQALRETVALHDGTRPFKPASPSQDESHNWRIWHGSANTRDYERDAALFFGEFGLQAVPAVETLRRFLPENALYPPNVWWTYHNAELDKLSRYADPVLALRPQAATTPEITLEDFVAASQEAQQRGLQIAIEHARRSKPHVSGCLVWQFNEPWYSICWSIVDYARVPKRAYHKIKELYNPVLVSFAYPLRPRAPGELVSGHVWLINDTALPIAGTLSAWLNDAPVIELDATVDAEAAQRVAALDVALADGVNRLRFEFRAGMTRATNEYDLNYCDVGEIRLRRAVLTDAAAWLCTSS